MRNTAFLRQITQDGEVPFFAESDTVLVETYDEWKTLTEQIELQTAYSFLSGYTGGQSALFDTYSLFMCACDTAELDEVYLIDGKYELALSDYLARKGNELRRQTGSAPCFPGLRGTREREIIG